VRAGAALALARIDPTDGESAAALQNEFVQIASLTAVAAAQAEQTNQLAMQKRENQAAAIAARQEAALAAQQAAARKRAEEAEAARQAAEAARQAAARKQAEQAEAARQAAEAARQDAYLTGLMNQLLLADQASLTADQLKDVEAKVAQLDPSAIPYLVRTINRLAATPYAQGELAKGMDFT